MKDVTPNMRSHEQRNSEPAGAVALIAFGDIPQDELARAVAILERPNTLAKTLALIGQPVDYLMSGLPKIGTGDMRGVVDVALLKCLEAAIKSLGGPVPRFRRRWMSTLITGLAGGIGGFFGPIALPVELVATSILLFRAIGEIAATQGEDLSQPDAWLACMEVIAFGTMRFDPNATHDYYSNRATLSAVQDEQVYRLLREHLGEASTLVMTRVTGDILVRVALVLTEVAASSSVPIVGAVSGFTVASVFTDHFQRIATGHFAIRRLERQHGHDTIRQAYMDLAKAA